MVKWFNCIPELIPITSLYGKVPVRTQGKKSDPNPIIFNIMQAVDIHLSLLN
jgi:hypothetical protein